MLRRLGNVIMWATWIIAALMTCYGFSNELDQGTKYLFAAGYTVVLLFGFAARYILGGPIRI